MIFYHSLHNYPFFFIRSTQALFTRPLHHSSLYLVHKGKEIHHQMEMSVSFRNYCLVFSKWRCDVTEMGIGQDTDWFIDFPSSSPLGIGEKKEKHRLAEICNTYSIIPMQELYLADQIDNSEALLSEIHHGMTLKPLSWSTCLSPTLPSYLPFQL